MNLYTEKYILGTLPSTTPFEMKELLNMHLNMIRSTEVYGWSLDLRVKDVEWSFGFVYDNQNTFPGYLAHDDDYPIGLQIVEVDEAIAIQKGDCFIVDYKKQDTSEGQVTIYMPAITTNKYLYVADDGSTYYDGAMTQLACAPGY